MKVYAIEYDNLEPYEDHFHKVVEVALTKDIAEDWIKDALKERLESSIKHWKCDQSKVDWEIPKPYIEMKWCDYHKDYVWYHREEYNSTRYRIIQFEVLES